MLFYTIKGIEEHEKEECFSYLWCVCGEESNCEKVFKDLVPKTLNYQEWELDVLLGSEGVGGLLLSVLLRSVEPSYSRC
jgi:hypothetical protein